MESQYVHLCRAERDEIFRLLKGGISRRGIAKQLGRSPATISREIRRNRSAVDYLPDTAHTLATSRRRRGVFKIDRHSELKTALLEGLAKRWSPEEIAATCHGKQSFCHETIYRYLYHAPFSIKMGLYQLLWREKPRRAKRRCRKHRGKIQGRVSIHERSDHINNRNHYHHWEADLMHFGKQKQSLITAIERKSRFLLVVHNPDGKSAASVAKKLSEAIAPFAPKSITLDNGLEFAQHQTLPGKTYFCDPYSSWQKGAVEHANGRIRRWLPKSYRGTITQETLDNIANILSAMYRIVRQLKIGLAQNPMQVAVAQKIL